MGQRASRPILTRPPEKNHRRLPLPGIALGNGRSRLVQARKCRCILVPSRPATAMVLHPLTRWLMLPCAVLAVGLLTARPVTAADDATLRIETEVFDDDDAAPLAHSLTLFAEDVAWDFLDISSEPLAEAATTSSGFSGEIILHDPIRERVVLIDPHRNVRTSVDTIQLERLSVSLTSWARQSDDRLICWAGGPAFGEGVHEDAGTFELIGPRVRYQIETTAAPSPDMAARYRRFADTAILLRALLHPGGVPPFPRLEMNRAIASAEALPTAVTLETEPRGGLAAAGLGGVLQRTLRSRHRIHPALRSDDLRRIADAEACMAAAEDIRLAAYTTAVEP